MKKLLVFTKYQRPHLFVQYSRGKTSFRAARIMFFFGGSACKGRSFVHFLLHCLVFVSFRLCFVKLRDVIRTSIIIALPHPLFPFDTSYAWGGVCWMGWVEAFLSCTCTPTWCYVIYFYSCHVIRTSLALTHLLHATVYTFLVAMFWEVFQHFHIFCTLRYLDNLMPRHKHFFRVDATSW